MRFNILTLFPGTVDCFFQESIIGRAVENGILRINIVNIRDYSADKHGMSEVLDLRRLAQRPHDVGDVLAGLEAAEHFRQAIRVES